MAKYFDNCNGTIQLWNWSPRYGAPGAPGALGGPAPQLVLRMRPTHIAMEMAHVLMIYHDLSIKNGDFHSYEF